jgi:predicted permease
LLDTDDDSAPPAAIVDETLARRYWPGEDPIGKRVRVGNLTSRNPWMTVVGVASAVKHASLQETATFTIYVPLAQATQWTVYLAVRSAGDPEALLASVRRQVAVLDRDVPLFEERTMEDALAQSIGPRRLTNLMLSAFAATALLLAVVGIYGVISLDVAGRVNEFGIRMALGARPSAILGSVLRRGLAVGAVGIGLGLAGSLALTRYLEALLFGVKPTDPAALTGATLVLVTAALAASYLPARRATRVDPIVALRCE